MHLNITFVANTFYVGIHHEFCKKTKRNATFILPEIAFQGFRLSCAKAETKNNKEQMRILLSISVL